MKDRVWLFIIAIIVGLGVLICVNSAMPEPVGATCEYYTPAPPHEPTGVKGCEVYGEGTASRYAGPGVARNDCVYPWTSCQPIQITSLQTGITIVVTPTMYCDCYTGTSEQRIVDLDPGAVAALGLDWDRGLYPVSVEPASFAPMTLPDTAQEPPTNWTVLDLIIGLGIMIIGAAWIIINRKYD
jgi:hypothetical protein